MLLFQSMLPFALIGLRQLALVRAWRIGVVFIVRLTLSSVCSHSWLELWLLLASVSWSYFQSWSPFLSLGHQWLYFFPNGVNFRTQLKAIFCWALSFSFLGNRRIWFVRVSLFYRVICLTALPLAGTVFMRFFVWSALKSAEYTELFEAFVAALSLPSIFVTQHALYKYCPKMTTFGVAGSGVPSPCLIAADFTLFSSPHFRTNYR